MALSNKVRYIIFAILLVIFIGSCVMLAVVFINYSVGTRIYEVSRQALIPVETAPKHTKDPAEGSELADEEEVLQEINFSVDFAQLQSVNPDVIAWIWIPDTGVSYPVLQGEDNDKYLKTTYDLKSNSAGSIFMDYRNNSNLSDYNTILYGHNMKNGAMFGELHKFRDKDYLKARPYVYLITLEGQYKYEIYSSYVGSAYAQSFAIPLQDDVYENFLDLALSSAEIGLGVKPTVQRSTLTLSTCTSVVSWQRYIIHACLVAE